MAKNKFVGCYVNEDEYNNIQQKVEQYGFKNASEYIRNALEFFDERRFNASKNNEISIIQDCINLLEGHRKKVQSSMINENLKNLEKNLKNEKLKNVKSLKDSNENLKGSLKGSSDETFKNLGENFKGSNPTVSDKNLKSFETVIDTLIRITHTKGRPSEDDFKFQARKCGKTVKEVMDYFDSNYDFFIRESDKLY